MEVINMANKKFIAKAVLVGEGKTTKVGEEIELTDAQSKRLLDAGVVEEAEVKEAPKKSSKKSE
jgi:hypothetical protein